MGSIRDFVFAEKAFAELQKKQREYHSELFLYTVPLHFFHKEAKPGEYRGSGTGVLIKLDERFFILTAGHCVQDAGAGSVAVGIRKEGHNFSDFFHRVYRYDLGTERDIGFFEIPKGLVGTIQAFDRAFLPESRLVVCSGEQLTERGDVILVSGYPVAHYQGDPQKNPKAYMFSYATILANSRWAPASRIPKTLHEFQPLDLWMSKSGNLRIENGEPQPVDLPRLLGSSGGGVWAAGMPDDIVSWKTAQIGLAGIHCSSYLSQTGEKDEDDFLRGLAIGHHLHLIADHYDDLREYILAKWPDVESYAL